MQMLKLIFKTDSSPTYWYFLSSAASSLTSSLLVFHSTNGFILPQAINIKCST